MNTALTKECQSKKKFQHGQEVFQINEKWKEFIQFTKLEMKGGA